ncbi:MAG TPA: hypothetical protein VFE62_20865 [Gemmataceae bacterium]|nr:hypothetical protein [Gemmataceae bacterium]
MKLPRQTEASFTRTVLQLAKVRGWRCAHFRAALTKKGWRTPVQGDGAGFPDLILVKGCWLIAAELKVGKNEPRPEQTAWLEAFASTGAFAYCWRPEDWDEIEAILCDGPTGGSVP